MKKSDNIFNLRTQRLAASFRDHWHMIFKSAAHNHLRLQEILRDKQGEDFCTLSFYSYTELKQYQKKTRIFGFGLTTGLAVFVAAMIAAPFFFDPNDSKAAGGPVLSTITPNSGPSTGGTSVTVSGSNFDGGIDGRTKLMLHGDGAGASITDSSITPKNVTVNSATQSAAQSKFGGSSILVGSGAYMTVGTSTDFEFTGDYTVDAWIYPTSAPATSGEIAAYGNHAGGGQFWDLIMLPSRTMLLNLYNNGYLYSLNTTTTVPLNTWTHVAGVRSGNNVYLFINGILSASATYSGTFTPTGQTLFIGRHTSSSSQYFPGYIDEFRISKGVAWWTSNFTPPTIPYMVPNLKLGGTQVTNILTANSTTITATTPVHTPGTVDVSFANYDGQSSTLTNSYTYTAPPTVTSVTPSSGLKIGGDSITITGTNFYGTPTVTLGGTAATSVTVVNATTITAITPAHTAGVVDVVVTNPDSQATTLTNGFTFNELAPIVSSINPTSGPAAGGTEVTIDGSNFAVPDVNTKLLLHGDGIGTNIVDFGAVPKTIDINGSPTQTTAKSKFGGSSIYFNGTSYLSANSPDFNFGTGDFTVDFWENTGGTSVNSLFAFGPWQSTAASSIAYLDWPSGQGLSFFLNGYSNSTPIVKTATTFHDNNWHHIAVVRSGNQLMLFADGVLRSSATYTGAIGTNIFYLGMDGASTKFNGYIDEVRVSNIARWTSDFTPPTDSYNQPSVFFDGIKSAVSFTNQTRIKAFSPAHVAGAVDVQVINPDSQSHTLSSAFTYIPAPTVTGISSSSVTNNQSVAGINITGTDFQSGATVKFKKTGETDIACTNVIFNSATSLSCDGDFHGVKPGSWDVEVTNADGQIGLGASLLNVIGEVTQIKFQTPSYTIKPNVASQAIRIQLQDSAGRPTKPQANATVDLSKTSTTGEFSLSRTSWSPISSITFTTSDDVKTVYYKDSTLGTHTIGGNENPSNNWTDASQIITVSNNAPYVWPFDVATDYQYDGAKVSIINSNASLSDLAASGTTINNVSSAALTYSSLTSFSEVLDSDNQGIVKYQLSNNNGTNWYWWNGSTWAAASGVAQANDAATINAHIATFNSAIGQIGNAKLSFKAFLIGDGTQKVNLDSIFVGYTLYPYKYSFISKPASLNETEEGTFVVQAQDQFGNIITVDHDTVVTLNSSTPATGFFATDLNEDISTRWDKTTVTIAAGQNSATFYYKDSIKGSKTISANPPVGESSIAASYGLTVTSKYRFLVTGISDPIQAGVPSSVTIQAADYLGNPVTDYTGTVHFTSTDGAASLPADNTLTAPMLGTKTYVNGVTLMTQADQCVSVTDLADPVITGSQCSITVTAPPAGVASKLKIVSAAQFVPVGEISSSITVQLQDINGDAAVKASSTAVYVYRTTASGEFSANGSTSWTSGAFSVTIPAGSTSANFFYKDTVIGNYTLTVADDNVDGVDLGLTNDSQNLSAVAGDPYSFSFNSSPTIIAGTPTGALNFSLRDSLGNQVTTNVNQVAVITSSNGGEFSLDGLTNWSNKLVTNIPVGSFENNFYYRNNTSGTDSITISDSDPADGSTGLVDAVFNLNVKAANINSFVFLNDPFNVNLGEVSAQMSVQGRDIYGNVAVSSGSTNVYLYSSKAGTTFSSLASPFVSINSVIIPDGGSVASFYLKQSANNGAMDITVSDSALAPDGVIGITDASQNITVSEGAVASLAVTSGNPLTVDAGQESSVITVESRNSSNVKVPMPSDKVVYFHTNSTASVKEFSTATSPSWNNVASATWPAGSDTFTFFYKDNGSGNKTIILGDDDIASQDNGITNAQLSVNVNPLAVNKLKITSSPITAEAGERGQLTVQLQDQYGNETNAVSDKVIAFSTDGSGVFTDVDGNTVSNLIISAGSSTGQIYYASSLIGTDLITAVSEGLIGDTQNFTVVAGVPVIARLTIADPNVAAGEISGKIQAKLYNSYDVLTNAPADLTLNITSNSTSGRFDVVQGGSFTSNSLALVFSAGSSTEEFYFADTKAGSVTIYGNGNGLNESILNMNVRTAAIDHIGFASPTQIITKGDVSSAITGKIYDQYENEVTLTEDMTLGLASSSATGEFSSLTSPWINVSSILVGSGQSSFSFYYKDSAVNVAQLTVSSPYGAITQTENIIEGPIRNDAPVKLYFQNSPKTFIINSAATFDFYLANAADEYTVAQNQTTATVSSSSATGRFYDGSAWVSTVDVVFEVGESVKSFQYKDSVSGNPILTITSAGLSFASQQETIINGSIEKIVLEAADNGHTVDRIPVTIKTMTNTDLPVAVNSDRSIALTKTSGYFYNDPVSWDPINSTIIPAGAYSKTVYFQQTVPGTATLRAQESPSSSWTMGQKDINIASVPSRLRFTTSVQTKQAGISSDTMTVVLDDIYGNISNTESDLILHLSSSSSYAKFSLSNTDWVNTSAITMAAGTSSASFYYRDTLAGSQTITVSDVSAPAESPDSGLTNANQVFAVTASDIFSLNILTSPNNLEIGQVSDAIAVQAQDQYGNAKIVPSDFTFYPYSSSATGKFSLSSDFADPSLIASVKILAGTSVANFRYRDLSTGNFQLTVSDKSVLDSPDSGIVNDSQVINVITGNVARIVWESVPSSIEEGEVSGPFVVKTTNSSGIEIPVLSDLQLYLSLRSGGGVFAAATEGPWSITSFDIPTGNSRATFYYKDDIAGTPLVTVHDELTLVENSDSGLTNTSSYINIVQGAITKIVFDSAPQSVIANHPSDIFQIKTLNKSDVPTRVATDKVIYLRSSSVTGEFSQDGATWGSNGIVISGGSYSGSFYYRDQTSGTYTLTAADTLPLAPDAAWTNAVQQVIIIPQQFDHFSVRNISDPQIQGTPSSLVVSPVDSGNFVIKEYAGTITEIKAFDEIGNVETAILPDIPYTFIPTVDKGIKTFTNGVAFLQAGEKTVMVTDSNGFTGSQQNITVIQASTNPIEKVKFIDTLSPLEVVKREASSLITLQLQDNTGDPVNVSSAGGYDLRIISDSDSAEFSSNGIDWNSGEIVLNVRQNINYATFYYRNSSKTTDQLTAMDWNGAFDEPAITNDNLDLNVIASQAAYMQITGSAAQVAGSGQEITIIAKDVDGDIATGYDGEKEVIFAGANAAFTGQIPTCSDKDGNDINLGQVTLLNFTDGQAKCVLKLYRKELAQIKAEIGSLNTYGDSSRNLLVDVTASIMDRSQSVLSVIPNPQQVGAPVLINILPKDVFGNIAGQSDKAVVFNVSGANVLTDQSFTFDSITGSYQASYIPNNPGDDLISATLNGANIKQDTEGVSDGLVHEKIEGTAIVAACNYLDLDADGSGSGKLVFNGCIKAGNEVKSMELSKSETEGTSISQIALKIKSDNDDFSGKVEVNSSDNKPSGMDLSSIYTDTVKYAPFIFYKVQTEEINKISQTTLRIIIPKQWMEDNAIDSIFAVNGKGERLAFDQVDSSSDNVVFEVMENSTPEYIAVLGEKKAEIVVIDEEKKEEDAVTAKVTPVNTVFDLIEKAIVSIGSQGSDQAEDEGSGKSLVSDTIAKLFGMDGAKAKEVTEILAIVSTGAAIASVGATAAGSFPLLSYMFGTIRTAAALPYGRKQRWGVVYDSQTGEPLTSALVIISDENGKVKEMKNTDQSGFYLFLAPKGIYTIDVKKSGYVPAQHSHVVTFETYYDSSYICGEKIELLEEEIISLNIPMIKQQEKVWQKIFNPSTLTHAIFWIGFIFSIFALVVTPNYWNTAILVFFIINFIVNAFYKKHLRPGKVVDANMRPAGFATVKIFDKADMKLLARTVANERGSYALIMNAGEYVIEAQGGLGKCVKEIKLSEHCEVKEKLVLQKMEPENLAVNNSN